jgi:hypothetical protein
MRDAERGAVTKYGKVRAAPLSGRVADCDDSSTTGTAVYAGRFIDQLATDEGCVTLHARRSLGAVARNVL